MHQVGEDPGERVVRKRDEAVRGVRHWLLGSGGTGTLALSHVGSCVRQRAPVLGGRPVYSHDVWKISYARFIEKKTNRAVWKTFN